MHTYTYMYGIHLAVRRRRCALFKFTIISYHITGACAIRVYTQSLNLT